MNNSSSPIYPAFTHWMLSHLRAMRFALKELVRAPFSSFITIFIIGVAMALPLGLFILLKNLELVDSQWNASAPTISLYLKSDLSQTQVNGFIQSLQQNSDIKKVVYVSPEEGLKSFEKNTPFSNVIELFKSNPIPGVITVLPVKQDRSPEKINTLFLSLKTLPFVDAAQLDMHWVERLYDFIAIGKDIVKALSILFCFGVILIIGHTLRTTLTNQLREIQVMRLVGATDAYIRRPLLYRGIFYGLFGGVIAWVLIDLFMAELQPPITQLAATYHASFHLAKISVGQGAAMLMISALLGAISACLIITQLLNKPEQAD